MYGNSQPERWKSEARDYKIISIKAIIFIEKDKSLIFSTKKYSYFAMISNHV